MTYFTMFYLFFRIGLVGFGGGLAMLPLIFQGVQDFGLMSRQEFSDLVALSQITPGPVAVNAATYVGFHQAGLAGAAVATFGIALPSFIIMLVVARLVKRYQHTLGVKGVFAGIRPVTAGLIAAAALMLAETALFNRPVFTQSFFLDPVTAINVIPAIIFGISFLLIYKLKMSPTLIILGMGVIGAFICG
jgi:chromate transporter